MLEGLLTLWKNPYLRGGAALALGYGLFRLLALSADLWGLFLGALLLAALVRPLVDHLERLRLSRGLSLVLVLLLLSLGVLLLAGLLVLVAEQLSGFGQTLPTAAGSLADWWNRLPTRLHQSGLPPWLLSAMEQTYGSLGRLLQGLVEQLVPRLASYAQTGLLAALAALVGGTIKLAAFVVLFVYLLADGPRMGRSLFGRLPEGWRAPGERTLAQLERAVLGYFRGQMLVAASLGLLVGTGLWLLGLPLAAPLGLLVGLLELIPYLGIALGAVAVAVVALPLGGLLALKGVALLLLAAQVEGHWLAPLIVGRSTALHPVTVLMALLLGERLAGLVGLLVAVPLVAFARLWLEDLWPPPPKAPQTRL